MGPHAGEFVAKFSGRDYYLNGQVGVGVRIFGLSLTT